MENHQEMLIGAMKCIQMDANHYKTLFCTSLKWFPTLSCRLCQLGIIFHQNSMGNHRIPSLQAHTRLRLTAPLQNKKNQEISIDLTSAELASGSAELRSGSAELGSAPAELQILGKFNKILLKSSRSSLRAGSETRSSLLGSSAGLGSQNLGKPWEITGKR